MGRTEGNTPVVPRFKSSAALVGWLALCFAVASVGALFPPGPWYAQLQKPTWNPPNWVFGPVWTLLYILMAVAAWLVWRQGGFAKQLRPLSLFLAQLACNAVWSWFSFGLHNLLLALADLTFLWVLLLLTTVVFWRTNKTAAVLLLPYLLWVTFAAALNLMLWRLNR